MISWRDKRDVNDERESSVKIRELVFPSIADLSTMPFRGVDGYCYKCFMGIGLFEVYIINL